MANENENVTEKTDEPPEDDTPKTLTAEENIHDSKSGIIKESKSVTIGPSRSRTDAPAPSGTILPSPSGAIGPSQSQAVAPAPSGSIRVSKSGDILPAPSGTIPPSQSGALGPSQSQAVAPAPSGALRVSQSGDILPTLSGTIPPSKRDVIGPSRSQVVTSTPSGTIQPSKSGVVGPSQSRTVAHTPSGALQVSPSGAAIPLTSSSKALPTTFEADEGEPPSTKGSFSVQQSATVSRQGSRVAASSRHLITERRTNRKTSADMSRDRGPERRTSKSKTGILSGSIISFRKYSMDVDRLKTPKFMNTYRLKSKNPFRVDRVNVVLRTVMMAALAETRYDPASIPKLCTQLGMEIRTKVKALQFDRYKIICKVEIGEKNMQGVCSAMRFLWDAEKDNYAFFKFENLYLFATACVFGVYFD